MSKTDIALVIPGAPDTKSASAQIVPSIQMFVEMIALAVRSMPRDEQEGLSPSEFARFMGVSPSTVHSLIARGLAPTFAQVGDGCCPRISQREASAWLLSGCPARKVWAAIREGAIRRFSF